MIGDLAGRVAFITGGSSGVGLGVARACREAGMKVAFTYRSPDHRDEALEQLGAPAKDLAAIRLEVEDREAWPDRIRWLQERFGPPDLLVANAGMGTNVPASLARFEDWDSCLNTNLQGTINTIVNVLPAMLAGKKGGQIVITASMSGLIPGGRSGVYSTSKFALVGLAESLRVELVDHGIGVSAFCPGLVRSRIGLPNREGAAPHQTGMDPLECGRLVLQGVIRNDLYILTHPEFREGVEERSQTLRMSFPLLTEAQPWWAVETNVVRCPIYEAELAKLRRRDQ